MAQTFTVMNMEQGPLATSEAEIFGELEEMQ